MPTDLGCICYLANHTRKAMDDIVLGLDSLQQHYRRRFPCPVYIFHEPEMTHEMRGRIRDVVTDVQFIEIRFPPAPPGLDTTLTAQAVGYRHMCHWFANDIFHHPVMARHKYYMRLDTDSQLLGPVNYDLFEYMDTHGCVYGYITEFQDQPSCAGGLWPLVRDYLAAHPEIKPVHELYKDIPEYRCYYTNFELCRTDWFRQEPWATYFKAVDDAGGIYSIRWGDHIIRYIGVRLFLQDKEVHHFRDIKYFHQGSFNC